MIKNSTWNWGGKIRIPPVVSETAGRKDVGLKPWMASDSGSWRCEKPAGESCKQPDHAKTEVCVPSKGGRQCHAAQELKTHA